MCFCMKYSRDSAQHRLTGPWQVSRGIWYHMCTHRSSNSLSGHETVPGVFQPLKSGIFVGKDIESSVSCPSNHCGKARFCSCDKGQLSCCQGRHQAQRRSTMCTECCAQKHLWLHQHCTLPSYLPQPTFLYRVGKPLPSMFFVGAWCCFAVLQNLT